MASLLAMHEHEAPDTADEAHEVDQAVEEEAPNPAPSDEVLDGFETDLDNVAAALDALDADDLDAAEALVNGLGENEPPVSSTESD